MVKGRPLSRLVSLGTTSRLMFWPCKSYSSPCWKNNSQERPFPVQVPVEKIPLKVERYSLIAHISRNLRSKIIQNKAPNSADSHTKFQAIWPFTAFLVKFYIKQVLSPQQLDPKRSPHRHYSRKLFWAP